LYYLSLIIYGITALGIGRSTDLNKGCGEGLQSISVYVVLFLRSWLIYNADFFKYLNVDLAENK
jgi:hypothetical protein